MYLDMGEQAGIVEGTRFEVVRLGEPLLMGGKVVGHEETIIGETDLFRVREGMSMAKVVKQEQPFEKGDRVYQLKKKVQRVAVAEFPYGDAFNDFTRNVQDMLYTSLTQKGMSVVERQKLEEVLREQKAAYTGIIDLATAAQVGKLLGVEGVLVGSVAELGNSIAITARLVDVEKGTAITAARVELPKTAEMGTMLARGSRGMTARATAEPSAPAVFSPATPSTAVADQRLAKGLKATAAALAQKAEKGLAGHEGDAGQSLIADYNWLVRQAKATLKADPFVQVLEETKAIGGGDVMASKVARLAKELELYFTSFVASQALKETAAALAKGRRQNNFPIYIH